jgi:acyl-CoA synthetase (AMP-forming)/AMP-acid ligase II
LPSEAPQSCTLSDLIDWLRKSLSSLKIPRIIEVATLPPDQSGKIAKRRLRAAH